MDSKILRSSQVAFVILISLLFWAGCTPPAPVKPWDSKFLNKIQLSFTDADTDAGQVGGDVLLQLNGAPKPNGIDQYVLYWGGTAGDSGKGNKIAEVSVDIDGNLLYKIPQNYSIPTSRNRYFLLYLQTATGEESYSGINTAVTDETQTAAEKQAEQEAKKAEAVRIVKEEKAAEAERVAESARIEEEKKVEEAQKAEEEAQKAEEKAQKAKKAEEEVQKAKEEARVAALATIVVENVLFEFDRSNLRSEFKRKLNNSFTGVDKLDQIKVVISGHADERGSNEYNLALGERRAFAVKRYLISLGLLEDNITVISYGEEKPVDPRHSETAWEMNRRSETDMKD